MRHTARYDKVGLDVPKPKLSIKMATRMGNKSN